MAKNWNKSFKIDLETEKLMQDALNKLNAELAIKLSLSALLRLAVKSFCMQVKSGRLSSKEILFAKP